MPIYIVDSRIAQTHAESDVAMWILFALILFAVVITIALIIASGLTRTISDYRNTLLRSYLTIEEQYRARPYNPMDSAPFNGHTTSSSPPSNTDS